MSFRDFIKKNRDLFALENFFLVIALLFGMAMAFIGVPFQECDGWEHFSRSVDVSYGNILSPIVTLNHDSNEAVVPANFGDISYRITEAGSGEGTEYKNLLKSFRFSKKSMTIGFHNGITSIFYYPQAVGLFIGRHIGLSVFGCVVLARIFNLIAFLILAYIAIRITPVLKNSMIVIALLPMTLYQAASLSYDAILNGLCFLFIAMCFNYAYGDKVRLGKKEALMLGTVLAFIFLCKYVYVFLGLLVFIIPKEKFGDKKEYFKSFMTALIPLLVIGIIAVYMAVSALSQAAPAPADAALDSVAAAMTPLEFIKSSPLNIIKVLYYTFINKFSDYILWLDVLGSLNYPLGPLIYMVPMFLLYVIGSDVSKAGNRIEIKDKLIALAAFALAAVCVIIGIYIGDTRINFAGEYVVQGVQGRYFIAPLPALAFVLAPRKRTDANKYFAYKLLACEVFILCIAIYFLRVNCS